MTNSRSDLARMMPDAFPVFFTGRQPYPGQAMVMPEVVKGHNVLFAAPTASGKTEAAIAPLYQRHITFRRRILSTIYVAPTKALVNDLYERLTSYLRTGQADVVARYTGDRHDFRSATGVFCLLATPEALDSLQLRRPEMLAAVRSIVIDEIHLLHGQPRGQQLRHVTARIRKAAAQPESHRDGFHMVGMTATLDDIEGVAETWLSKGAKVFSHGAPREIDLKLISVSKDGDPYKERARSLAHWLHRSAAEKVLVFAISRNKAHLLAAYLHRELEGTRWPVHLHFGAMAAAERERVEDEMRSRRFGVCVATNTLEIGIDIGDVDTVVLSNPPRSVSGFLQRIGRGNRRSGICRVLAFRGSDDDEYLIRALMDCGRRGDLDDLHDYDRPSVRFQQVLSLCWRATRQDRPLSVTALCAEADTEDHRDVINDMIGTGSLINVRGALVPCDRLMDEADAGKMHTVISSRVGSAVVDMRTGTVAIRDADESTVGGALYHGGSMRQLLIGSEGGTYLGGAAPPSQGLARIRGTLPALAMGRSVIWGIARQKGYDPTRWHLGSEELTTWGGAAFNTLLAALFSLQVPGQHFRGTPQGVTGPVFLLDISLNTLRDFARSTESAGNLPLVVASKFANSSRYLKELSPGIGAVEKRNSIPWRPFFRWLDRVEGIDIDGTIPVDACAQGK